MNRLQVFLICGVISLILLFSGSLRSRMSAVGDNGYLIWAATSLAKVRPNDPPNGMVSASLTAARNEYEAFQTVVTAGSSDLLGVDVTVSNLTSRSGSSISKKNIRIYKAAYINVTEPSNLQGRTGEWPDALIPKVDDYVKEKRNAFPFSVTAGRNQPIWIEIYVPPNTDAGDYKGRVIISAQNQPKRSVNFKLTVWNFTLPTVPSLKTAFTVGTVNSLAKGHFGTHNVSQDEKLRLLKLYTLAELKHRLSNDYCTYPAPNFDGVSIDWTQFDKNWGPFLNGTVLPSGERLTSIRLNDDNGNTDEFYRLYVEHFKKKGWFDRLFHYTADEPQPGDFENIKNKAAQLHRVDPKLRVLVTTEYRPVLEGTINKWTPIINYVENKEGLGRAAQDNRDDYNSTIAAGNELWWYQSCFSHGCDDSIRGNTPVENYFTNWPSYMIDLPSISSRIMEWLSWRYQISGELYYLTTYAYNEGNPWTNQYYFSGNGDGTLFYPGKPEIIGGLTDIPVESIRLKMIRDGQEDYEYFKLLADHGQKDFVDNQVGAIAPKTYSWNQDPEQLLSVRAKLGVRLNEILR